LFFKIWGLTALLLLSVRSEAEERWFRRCGSDDDGDDDNDDDGHKHTDDGA
jgi:hypothetical protein